ncbi:MAG: hypothetical protein AAGD11_21125 [Planctomycetota bacterium]
MFCRLVLSVAGSLILSLSACGNSLETRSLSKSGEPRIYQAAVFSSSHFKDFETKQNQSWLDHVLAYAERCALPSFAEGTRIMTIRTGSGMDYLYLRPEAAEHNTQLTDDDVVFRMILGVNRESKFVADQGVKGAEGVNEAIAVGKVISGQFAGNRPLRPLGACPNTI